MLVQTDRNELGDKRLDPKEGLAKLKEENKAITDARKIEGQEELENQERSAGPRIYWTDLIRKLQECNPQLQFKDGSPGAIAVYRPKRKDEYKPEDWDWTKDPFWNDHEYATGFMKEWIPEYAHVIVDARGRIKKEYRGWRSILLSLIKSRAISYEATVKHFGRAKGERSRRWYEQIREIQNPNQGR